MNSLLTRLLFLVLISTLIKPVQSHAQLNTVFERIFNRVLDEDLFTDPLIGGNFDESAAEANLFITPSLNQLIANNVSSFPLSSMVAGGVQLNLSGQVQTDPAGRPILKSLAPIFGESVETVGPGNFVLGTTYSYYDLARYRGLDTDAFQFTFTSRDLTRDGTLGDFLLEAETIDIFPNLNVSAHNLVVFGTYGLARGLDIGIAVPITRLRMSGHAMARINSLSFVEFGAAFNNYNDDPFNPLLIDGIPYDEESIGVGDITFRAKYAPGRASTRYLRLAVLGEARFPWVCDDKNFLCTGSFSARFMSIVSAVLGDFSPHLNVGYDYKNSSFSSNEVDIILGFEQRINNYVTMSLDALGTFQVSDVGLELLQERQLMLQNDLSMPGAIAPVVVRLHNLPQRDRDHVIDLSIGFKWATLNLDWIFFANVLLPLQDGGLRSYVAPVVGLSRVF